MKVRSVREVKRKEIVGEENEKEFEIFDLPLGVF